MEAIDIKIKTTRQDWIAFHFRQLLEGRETRRRLLLWAFMPPALLVALALLITFQLNPGTLHAVGIWVSVLTLPFYLMLVYGIVHSRLDRQVEASIKAGLYVGAFEMSLSPEGITVTRGSKVVSKNWKEIPRVNATANCGFLYLSQDDIILIPHRCFSDETSFEMFVKSGIIFQWHGENAIKAAAATVPVKEKAPEPVEIKPIIIPMPAAGAPCNAAGALPS